MSLPSMQDGCYGAAVRGEGGKVARRGKLKLFFSRPRAPGWGEREGYDINYKTKDIAK